MTDSDYDDLLDAFDWVVEPAVGTAHSISDSELLRAIVRGELGEDEL